jgi:hypothetical protein
MSGPRVTSSALHFLTLSLGMKWKEKKKYVIKKNGKIKSNKYRMNEIGGK